MYIYSPVGESNKFATNAEYGLYLRALDWSMQQVLGKHDPPPAQWVVPDSVIAGWNARRTANQLVADGIWEHDDYGGGYVFVYLHRRNDPRVIQKERSRDRKRRAAKLSRRSVQNPPETRPELRVIEGKGA
jgi:hypothetical protein